MRRASVSCVAAIALVVGACSSSSKAQACQPLSGCQSEARHRFGHPVLVPTDATFVQGAVRQGVLGLEFRDTETGRTYSVFAGRPGNSSTACKKEVVQGLTRNFCFGRSTTALMAQFVSGNLLYTVSVPVPSTSSTELAAADRDLMSRIVLALR